MRPIASEEETECIDSKARNAYANSQSTAKANCVGDTLTAPLVANSLETKTQISKYHSKGGHGFAAEDANNLADRLHGAGRRKS